MNRYANIFNPAIILALLFGFGFKCGSESVGGAPTKSEIKETLQKRADSIYLTDTQRDYYKVEGVKLDFDDSSIKVGSPVDKQVEFGVSGKSVYPVRVKYTRTITYTDDREPKTEEIGDGVIEYFYKDGFGEWKARAGSDG